MFNSPTPPEFLTFEEVAEVDRALMTSREKFSARVALYSLRSLKLIAQKYGVAIADLDSQQIADWVAADPTFQANPAFDEGFKGFFTQLVISSFKPLKQIALTESGAIEDLTVPQVINWFEQEAKLRLEKN
ncbi:MAG: hypothetical protein KME15_03245 [Drouetiella hepatica Uher 2000/2452]|jgi:hypothetical protein|uniref:Uncharacterized protein n=1 Tax=Drouetiella hepatica Uher 2000/2452 TaxID=904376 RepID=A0A951ULG6_9CYAN|nr:hypothetical protein [Drouetiella hepatica Uher 2000/2452]